MPVGCSSWPTCEVYEVSLKQLPFLQAEQRLQLAKLQLTLGGRNLESSLSQVAAPSVRKGSSQLQELRQQPGGESDVKTPLSPHNR